MKPWRRLGESSNREGRLQRLVLEGGHLIRQPLLAAAETGHPALRPITVVRQTCPV